MHRTPKSGNTIMYSSQPNLHGETDEVQIIRNFNIKKRKNEFDQPADINDSLMQSFREVLNVEMAAMKEQNAQILQSNTEILKLLQANTTHMNFINEKVCNLESELLKAKQKIEELEIQTHIIQMAHLKNKVELRNIPKQDNDDLQLMLAKLYETLDFKPKENLIEAFRRGKNHNSPIVLEFQNFNDKETLLKKARLFNHTNKIKLNCRHLGINIENKRVYISECSTTRTKGIFNAARELVQKGMFKYCWISRGNVLMRKEDDGQTTIIKSLRQIEELSAM